MNIIKGTKAGTKEKLLASQFISRYFKYFTKQMAISIDAIFDLCEDEDVNVIFAYKLIKTRSPL